MPFPTLNNFVTPVQLNLGNRADLAVRTGGNPSRIDYWLEATYRDFAYSYPFSELETSIPDQFTYGNDTYNYPANTRALKTINIVGGLVGISTPWPVRRRDIKVIRRYTTDPSSFGTPSVYAPFNLQIIIRPVPNGNYQFIWDVWQKPTILNPIWTTQVQLPDDWFELLILAATLRGHIALIERDKAKDLNILLNGDPVQRNRPGLIKQKILNKAAENYDSEFAIRPLNRRITNTP